MTKPFYITTAIDYSNGDPHLGHALEKVGADAIARWHRLQGKQVRFLMGMDEHGQKVYQSALAGGATPSEWVETISQRFERTWRRLHCSHDDWMRTTEPRHARGVTALLERIKERNPDHLYVGEYEGLYCVGCEEFKQPGQIVDGRCAEHPSRELVPTKERNTFFKLSEYTEKVRKRIDSDGPDKFRVEPGIRRNEILRVLDEGLQDISVSRGRLPWGIPFPGSDDETVYVWFDALINYLSATGYPDGNWDGIWPANLHVVGKGITRFHCLIWPAMLMAADVALPKQVWAHGYVQWDGAKVSKSEGAAVSLDDVIDRHGPDALRYFLLREVGFENDGDFTFERFDARYNSDLANGLGNLASRTTAMLAKYRNGKVPQSRVEEVGGLVMPSHRLATEGKRFVENYEKAMNSLDLRGGAEAIEDLVSAADRYIVEHAPWILAKNEDDLMLDFVLAELAECLTRLTVMSSPFMPQKAQELWGALGQPGTPEAAWSVAKNPAIAGAQTHKPENLFPKPPTA